MSLHCCHRSLYGGNKGYMVVTWVLIGLNSGNKGLYTGNMGLDAVIRGM